MSSTKDEIQKGLIITDDVAVNPILDFDSYRDAIVNIIKNSYPKFTIGIFGEWGTGKTTLMNSIYKKLGEHESIVVVDFETWRYEREDQFALVPLLKTISYSLPNSEKFDDLEQKLKRVSMDFLKKSPEILSSVIGKYMGETAKEITDQTFESFKNGINTRMELLAEVDRDTLYFDGFKEIQKELNNLRKTVVGFRIVVFIDDLDRCSPKKTLEILESIKVFLGMDCFIYVIGMSHDIVKKLIDIEYKETGVKGEQYIKKIIQIPITLPIWDKQDVSELIRHLVDTGLINGKYKEIIRNNIDLISAAIDNNPREIKRFLNSFIVSFEIFEKNGIVPKELLILQAIQLRWEGFYRQLIKYGPEILKEIRKYLESKDDDPIKLLESDSKDEKFDYRYRLLLRESKSNELWNFLEKYLEELLNIQNWSIYRRAVESTKKILPPKYENSVLLDVGGLTSEVLMSIKILEHSPHQLHDDLIIKIRDLSMRLERLPGFFESLLNPRTPADQLRANLQIQNILRNIERILSSMTLDSSTIMEVKMLHASLTELKKFLLLQLN